MMRFVFTHALVVTACARPEVYQCSSAEECDQGSDGRCELTGVCSYSDSACSSGRRYSDVAGALSGECVALFNAGSNTGSNDAVDAPPPVDGLVAYWPLDVDGTDVTGNGHDGILVNSPTLVAGHVGMAYEFNGTNLLQVDDLDGAAFPVTGTVTMWLRGPWSIIGTHNAIFDSYGSTRTHVFLRVTGTPKLQLAAQVTSTEPVPYAGFVEVPQLAEGWHHIAFSWDTTSSARALSLYVDGIRRGTDPIDPGWVPTDEVVRFMGYFPGTLDDVRLYNRVLSPEEIQALL